jgi:hypothetical protein
LLFFYSGRQNCIIRPSTDINARSYALISLSSNILQKEAWISKKRGERGTRKSPHKKRERKEKREDSHVLISFFI